MSKKKMCLKYIKPFMVGDTNMAGICVARAFDPKCCPRNTNSRCEIIPAKPKLRRVKAWAEIVDGDIFCDTTWSRGSVRVTILIHEKYFKG